MRDFVGLTALACVGKDHGLARILGSLQGERRWQGEGPWLLRAVFAIDYFLLLYSPGPYDVPAFQRRRVSHQRYKA